MPLQNFESICSKHALQIVSRDTGNPQYHRANNRDKDYVTHYKIDGVVLKAGNKCDFLLIDETKKKAYFIELKGSDLTEAAKQIEATELALRQELVGYNLQYRIVANKCKTQEIYSTGYKKYRMRWKGHLMQKTGWIEEDI